MQIHLVRALAVTAAALSFTPADAAAQSCSNTSVPCQLSAGLAPSTGAFSVALAPNGARVAFVHFAGATGTLYSVPAGGGTPVRLSPIGATTIANLTVSPDSQRLIYTATLSGSTNRSVLSVPLAGPASAGVVLLDHMPSSRPIISPDSQKVVVTPTANQLRVVPIAGPASAGARLTDPMVTGAVIAEFAISDNSQSVVYRADQQTDNVVELYQVPLTLTPLPDPPTTKLSGPMVSGGDVLGFVLHPGTGRLAYHADQDTNDVAELYTVGITGASRVKVNVALPSGWDVTEPEVVGDLFRLGYSFPPGGTRLVYEIEQRVGGVLVDKQLYSVPPAGPASSSVRLDNAPSGTMPDGYQISRDSARVVYIVADDDVAEYSTRSVPIAGPASSSAPIASTSERGDTFKISPNSARVVWLLDNQVLSSPIAGGTPVPLDGNETDVSEPHIDATSARVVYRGRLTPTGDRDVFSVPLTGSGTRFNLTQSLAAANINSLVLTGDGLRAVYEATAAGGGVHLYSSRLVP